MRGSVAGCPVGDFLFFSRALRGFDDADHAPKVHPDELENLMIFPSSLPLGSVVVSFVNHYDTRDYTATAKL